MSRNRVKNSQSLHWMGVMKWILIAGLLAGLGLSYMLRKNQNLHLAEETHVLQMQLDKINARNAELEGDLASMKSMESLQQRLQRMRSSLVPWNDSRASWVRLDQNTRAIMARIGTQPRHSFNLNLNPPVASVETVSTQGQP